MFSRVISLLLFCTSMQSHSKDEFQHKFQRADKACKTPSPSLGTKNRTSSTQMCKESPSSIDKHQTSSSSPQDDSFPNQTSEESENCDNNTEKFGLKGGSCHMKCDVLEEGNIESKKLYGILQSFAGGTQKNLKNEVEQIRCQLICQRKALEYLNQTVGGLQSESSQHTQRIEQIREDTKLISTTVREQKVECMMEEKIQEVWSAMMRELTNLKDYIKQWAESEQCNRNESIDALSRELQESKTFLWKEVENLRADLEDVQSRLGCQETEICTHHVDIKAIKHIQAKCRKEHYGLPAEGDEETLPIKSKDHILSANLLLVHVMCNQLLWGHP
ncbi:coiled-coil domain-containing protein 159-like isoform X2 [Lissotriton helveticus]